MRSTPLKLSTLQSLIDDKGDQAEAVLSLCKTVIRLKDYFEQDDNQVIFFSNKKYTFAY